MRLAARRTATRNLDVASAHDDLVVVWAHVPSDVTSLVDLLDPVERARLHELHVEAERRRYVAAHALLRLVVAETTGTI